MAKYSIKTVVEYFQEVECDTEEEAEELGWQFDDMNYGGVYSIEVEELESDEDE